MGSLLRVLKDSLTHTAYCMLVKVVLQTTREENLESKDALYALYIAEIISSTGTKFSHHLFLERRWLRVVSKLANRSRRVRPALTVTHVPCRGGLNTFGQ